MQRIEIDHWHGVQACYNDHKTHWTGNAKTIERYWLCRFNRFLWCEPMRSYLQFSTIGINLFIVYFTSQLCTKMNEKNAIAILLHFHMRMCRKVKIQRISSICLKFTSIFFLRLLQAFFPSLCWYFFRPLPIQFCLGNRKIIQLNREWYDIINGINCRSRCSILLWICESCSTFCSRIIYAISAFFPLICMCVHRFRLYMYVHDVHLICLYHFDVKSMTTTKGAYQNEQ